MPFHLTFFASHITGASSDGPPPVAAPAAAPVAAPAPVIFESPPPYTHDNLATLPLYQLSTQEQVANALGAIAVTSFGALGGLFVQTIAGTASRRNDLDKAIFDLKNLVQHLSDLIDQSRRPKSPKKWFRY